ncbi:gliding motility-associated C-terminal domain-containing protein [Psychroserpens sp.]|uniref:gliding motility-associated C-terminal domain-containing protein n=1 Tax=Psychroserpens sp. TaxID=2020870 RepID=UPI00385FE307
MRFSKFVIYTFFFAISFSVFGQDIELFQQFNGRYDYTAIGNTLNPFENNIVQSFCNPLESSTADLNLSIDNTIVAAYLYWAGSGTSDSSVELNGIPFEADGIYNVNYLSEDFGLLNYFSCYTDITDFIISEGNTTYELSNLDITEALASNIGYCETRTNFAGWSVYIIYQNDSLPLNQVNLYQGLDIINSNNQEITIVIDNLNVIDNSGAKIGFLAWEGDDDLNYGESLSFNGNVLSNPPLNFVDNAFNGTNTFTNSTTFFNGDLDVYNIQDNISIGDTSATIEMTTGVMFPDGIRADLIMLNNIITVLNSQLPDGTITLDDYSLDCNNKTLTIDYTVFNVNSTAIIPANTSIAFYANGILFHLDETQNDIPINGFENNSITITIPSNISEITTFNFVIDDDGSGNGSLIETNENNNNFETQLELLFLSPIELLPNTIKCNEGFNSAVFDLIYILEINNINTPNEVYFYNSLTDLESNSNQILNPENYNSTNNPQTIHAIVGELPCYTSYAFDLLVENCPASIPGGFSPNNDGINDWFNIQGLYNIFEKHELKIFNRYGTLIFEGDNDTPWLGKTNRGINNLGKLVPVGTYYYILNYNEPNYEPSIGWVYVNY